MIKPAHSEMKRLVYVHGPGLFHPISTFSLDFLLASALRFALGTAGFFRRDVRMPLVKRKEIYFLRVHLL